MTGKIRQLHYLCCFITPISNTFTDDTIIPPLPNTMVFVDVRFYESRKTVTAKRKTKVVAKESNLLRTVVRNAVVKLLNSEGKDAADSDIDAAIKRIEAITTNTTDPGASDLIEFLESPDTRLEALNTNDTPILADGIDIHLPKEIINVDDYSDEPEPALNKQKVCAFVMMMGTTAEKGRRH
jgi:hypothetical protein